MLAAAKVGGISANLNHPAEHLEENLLIQSNVIGTAARCGVKGLLFVSSCCVYPKGIHQPMSEESLMAGKLDGSNEGYALAKICGQKACDFYRKEYGVNFFSVVPANLYGYNDSFDLQRAHVIPAMIRRFHEAKEKNDDQIVIWGSGNAKREFLFADDLADACFFLLQQEPVPNCLNVGYGKDYTTLQLAQMVKQVVGFKGAIETDPSKPEGPKRRFMDSGKINELGWKPKISIEEGLDRTYKWYLEHERANQGIRK